MSKSAWETASDANRTDYTPRVRDLVISPENARSRLLAFLRKARLSVDIYDPNLSDDEMAALLEMKAARGVRIRILGSLKKKWAKAGFDARPFPGKRLHVRAIVRDGVHRKPEPFGSSSSTIAGKWASSSANAKLSGASSGCSRTTGSRPSGPALALDRNRSSGGSDHDACVSRYRRVASLSRGDISSTAVHDGCVSGGCGDPSPDTRAGS